MFKQKFKQIKLKLRKSNPKQIKLNRIYKQKLKQMVFKLKSIKSNLIKVKQCKNPIKLKNFYPI
jgi:hypothetical protein